MKFRKLVCVVLALAAVLCVAGCSGKKDADAPDGMILASSDEADYLFTCPINGMWMSPLCLPARTIPPVILPVCPFRHTG